MKILSFIKICHFITNCFARWFWKIIVTVQCRVICSVSTQTCRETTSIISECNLTLAVLSLRGKLKQVNLRHLFAYLHDRETSALE